MYNVFNSCISDFSHEGDSEDYWYDCAIVDSIEMLNQFSDDDWQLLIRELENKPVLWQKRLVECLGGGHNSYEIKIILELINTEDEDLFIACIDTLRSLNLSDLSLETKERFLTRAKLLMMKSKPPVKKVLEEFINKIPS
ncbi:hypothetical protein PEC301877_40110 [Pectobacterium carotovorum subsp. carotovorum]|nr:hypothetical protein PEC301877_40110 [Pectobacterium carotovorum subsp. carotovorum]GKX45219.1 hypothetical protein SOASR015_42530 [Pectobacterium carotovorum subsp. carotovorum]GLX58975.1 hypothetical protein Pcaca02_42840 [Pectobacterium carotovorum subsp. carotovorum]